MRSVIRWAVRNPAAMNTMIVMVMVVGAIALFSLRRETFPKFELDMVLTTVVYPGASPEEVERGVCQKIEEAVRSIEGLKQVFSVAKEGSGFVICQLKSHAGDPQRVLEEVRSAVDRIPGFPPKNAEDAEIKLITFPTPAVRVAVLREGDPPNLRPENEPQRQRERAAERQLRDLTEEIHDELLRLPSVSVAEVLAAKPYQIDLEISEATLQKYRVTLPEVAGHLAQQNIDMPAGTFRTDAGEFRLSGRNQRVTGEDLQGLLAIPGHKDLTVAQVAQVRDGFEDIDLLCMVNGQRAMCLEVSINKDEDLIKVVDEVQAYVERRQANMPNGYRLVTWFDQSEQVKDRLELLTSDGLSGLLLVVLLLGVFLELRLAFWVAMGVPFSVLGACAVMLYCGETLNMVSMFAILMALGILVDDAIVIGENVYSHRRMGKSAIEAAIDGTAEVAPSVINSVATTTVAFIPLFYVSGITGKFIAVMPLAIIAMLATSLLEALTALPCHLAQLKPARPESWNARFRGRVDGGVHWFVQRVYLPVLRFGLARPMAVVSVALVSMLLALGLFQAGFTPFEYMPKLDSNQIQCRIEFVDGTPATETDRATRQIEANLRAILTELAPGEELIQVLYRAVGTRGQDMALVRGDVAGHLGEVVVQLVHTEDREPIARRHGASLHSEEIIRRWRQSLAGSFVGVQSMAFGGVAIAPGGKPIEFKLVGQDLEQLRGASRWIRGEMAQRVGVFDIADDNRLGKTEIRLKKNATAQALNLTEQELYQDVRARYYGAEVMRLQRGRHEVKLMVRHPPEERRSWGNFYDIRLPLADGSRVPLTEVADVSQRRPYMEINRLDQQRSISVFADVDTDLAGTTADGIVTEMRAGVIPAMVERFPGVSVSWQGQRQERDDSLLSMAYGFAAALLAMFLLLTLEFRSYVQPLILMMAIPCGFVGAVVGHLVMGLSFTIFSTFGLVTLAGIVVNDAIVLLDFINRRIGEGIPVRQTLLEAGAQRFRPVFLTTITTVIGLLPIVVERSVQAQVVIPMAVTLAFGQAMSMVWVLILVPSLYLLYVRGQSFTRRFRVRTAQAHAQLGESATAWWRERRAASASASVTSPAARARRPRERTEPAPAAQGSDNAESHSSPSTNGPSTHGVADHGVDDGDVVLVEDKSP